MEQRELLMNFMRSLKAKGLLDKDIHGSVVDVFIHSELPRLATNDEIADVSLCANCGVPDDLHNTCCGWDNASIILKPNEIIIPNSITGEERKQRWLDSQHRG